MKNLVPKSARRRIGKIGKRAIRKPGMRFGRWDAAEHRRFLEAMEKFGNSWKLVCDYIKTRTADQIRSHAQKYYEGIKSRLIKEMKEDPSKKKAIFVVTREYWNTNGLSRAFLEKNSAVSSQSKARSGESSTEKCLSPAKEPKIETPEPALAVVQAPQPGEGVTKRSAFYQPLSGQAKFGMDPAWLMLAQSCAYANSMLLNGLQQQYNTTSIIAHNP